MRTPVLLKVNYYPNETKKFLLTVEDYERFKVERDNVMAWEWAGLGEAPVEGSVFESVNNFLDARSPFLEITVHPGEKYVTISER